MPIKHNIVFVKNKLITVDTILPFLIELKKDYNYSSEIVIFDKLAYRAINENIVIKDGIKYVGKQVFITKGINSKILRRIYLVKGLFIIFVKSIFGANLFHFGALDQYPLKIIGVLFKKNVYKFPGVAYNFQYPKFSKFHGNKPKKFKKVGDNCVVFNGNFDYCGGVKFTYDIVAPRTRKVWIDYIRERSDYYLNEYHSNIKVDNGFIVVITGPTTLELRKLVDPYNDSPRLFRETIDILTQYSNKIPILIKPHPLTDMSLLKEIISDKDNVFITYLHPTVLSLHARVFIANLFSNTLADAYSLGVDTIEYTNYNKKLLSITSGKSLEKQFVTHFINNDYNKLESVVGTIISRNHKTSSYTGICDNNLELVNKITHK